MSFRINTNVAALTAHTSSVGNNRNLSNSLAKLSSGLRINKAADDASGLAIANSLRSQASSLGQAVANGNDAIGLIQTADGALSEYSSILDTIKTKSIQAASDGQTTTSRLAIQKDIDRLLENLSTIAKTTSFNGQKLLSGSYVNKEFQMGANANETVKASIANTEPSQVGQTTRADLNVFLGNNQLSITSSTTGRVFELENVNILMNNKYENGMGKLADVINRYSNDTGVTAKAVVEVTTKTPIQAGQTGQITINGILIGNGIDVAENDADGTLINAINNKTSETGVVATRTSDGGLKLSTNDGRTINVEFEPGETESRAIFGGSTAADMSTIGYLEVVQVGSSAIQIAGADVNTLNSDVALAADKATNIVEDSSLRAGSELEVNTKLYQGSQIGFDLDISAGNSGTVKTVADSILAAGSTLATGTVIANGTEIKANIITSATVNMAGSMVLKAGSILMTGTKLAAGTIINQDINIGGNTIKAGTKLTTDIQLDKEITLIRDMTLSKNSSIISGSTIAAGTVLNLKEDNVTLADSAIVQTNMTLKKGSTLASGSTLKAGSVVGGSITLTGTVAADDTKLTTVLKAGSVLASGSTIKEGSSVGGKVEIGENFTAKNGDVLLKAGTMLASGSTIKAGTALTNDIQVQDASGNNTTIKAGQILTTDAILAADAYLNADMIIAKDSIAITGSQLVLSSNIGGSVILGNQEFTNLSNINVLTLQDAMKAIDTVTAAIVNIDTIRSDLGSAQNQVTSIINNISVAQVNITSAESNIRDVDFAAESASFSKYNILAQSGTYAMSQANAVQQNVMRLLQ